MKYRYRISPLLMDIDSLVSTRERSSIFDRYLSNSFCVINTVGFPEICKPAAQSQVAVIFKTSEFTVNADIPDSVRLLEIIRLSDIEKCACLYQDSLSEPCALAQDLPQTDTVPWHLYAGIELGSIGNEIKTIGIFSDIRESCQATTKYQAVST